MAGYVFTLSLGKKEKSIININNRLKTIVNDGVFGTRFSMP